MKRLLYIVIMLALGILLVACSSDSAGDKAATEEAADRGDYSSANSSDDAQVEESRESKDKSSSETEKVSQVNRKIIYTAHLNIEVKNYQKALDEITTQVSDRGGYIVESNMYGDDGKDAQSGSITVRIPQEQFKEFISRVEEGSAKVLESSISGQDVTEEYIDLESRLKAKRVVEKRLLSFMEKAEKTEDLLAISEDLAKVQGEIEEITGRMKYLQNKSDLATVTIRIHEKNVTITGLNEEDLNTWEKTKQQFLESINFLITTFSAMIVFFVGNLPVFILLAVVGLFVYWIVRKRNSNHHQ